MFCRRLLTVLSLWQEQRTRKVILKTGLMYELLLQMDDCKFQRHIRSSRSQFDHLLFLIQHDNNSEADITQCGRPRISVEHQLLMVLWCLANDNSFREISNKFAVTQSCDTE